MKTTDDEFQVVAVTLVQTVTQSKEIYVRVPKNVDVTSLDLGELYHKSSEVKSFESIEEEEGVHFINNVKVNSEDEVDFIYEPLNKIFYTEAEYQLKNLTIQTCNELSGAQNITYPLIIECVKFKAKKEKIIDSDFTLEQSKYIAYIIDQFEFNNK